MSTHCMCNVQATRSHRRIKEEYKLEKAKADDAEDTLRDRIKFLKKKIREEKKTQILYEVRHRHTNKL